MASKLKQKGQMVSGSLVLCSERSFTYRRRPLVGRGFATSGAMALGFWGKARGEHLVLNGEAPKNDD